MKIQIDTPSYNDRRYGKPYIARIDFAAASAGEPAWGDWVGQPGEAGLLVIEADVGDVLMQGQKDFRNSRNSAPDYYIVAAGGALSATSKVEAYKHFQALAKPATA
jgi:hypothetical protein